MKPTQEQVIAWAREAGFEDYRWTSLSGNSELDRTLQVGEYPVGESVFALAILAYEAGSKDAFQDGAKAMFDALLFRVANNWHPRAQEQCDVENEWATAWAADALDEVSPEDCAEWKSIKESWKDGYEAGRKDENEACAKVCEDSVPTYIKDEERWLKGQNGKPDVRLKELAPNLEAAWEQEQLLRKNSVLKDIAEGHTLAAAIRARREQ